MQRVTVGDYFQALSLPMSMLVAWLTFKATATDLRDARIIEDVAEQLREFLEACRKFADDVEIHYVGEYAGGFSAAAAKESRKKIMAQLRALEDRRAVLDVFLSTRKAAELRWRFDEWQKAALGDAFPVMRKEDRCKPFDAPVVALRRAQSFFERYLADVRKACSAQGRGFRGALK